MSDSQDADVQAQIAALERQLAELKRQTASKSSTTVGGDQVEASGPVATRSSALNTGSGTAIVGHIVNLYRERGTWNEADYRAALERYLTWVCAATSRVVLRGIKRGGQQAVELPLDDVYVPLAAEALPAPLEELKRGLRRGREPMEAEAVQHITMRELLTQGDRLAVIGAPGCGKTTVLQHIAWTLAEALSTGRIDLAAERLGISGQLPLPIYVPLSLYAEHREQFARDPDPHRRQLAAFINHHLIERQAGLKLPDDFFATLLDNGQHVILLLDGLDEVANEDERALVAQSVRELTFGREHARFVVTSRTAAYQGRAVLGADFRTVRVLPLQSEQVANLIRRAYAAIYPAEVEQDERDHRAADLITGVESMETERAIRLGGGLEERLATTPLLVRMLLIVHFNLRRLPDQRAELYMEVVDTLLTSSHNPDEAVAQRLAALGGDWRGRRDLCQYLAFSIHDRGRKSGRAIGERELSDLLYGYLTKRRHKPPEAAEALVTDFVATNRQRGGLMEEQGGRHRFTHLSFQEFLTARYLAETERDVERIARFIEKPGRAGQPWWREPILLTIGYLNLTAQDTATDLVRRLAHLDTAKCPHTAGCLATAELAATAFLEWGGTDTTRQALAQHLADLLAAPDLEGSLPGVRGLAGRALGRLGDPRPGVRLTAEGLPDIVWCDVPAGEFIMCEGADQHSERIETPFRISKYPITNAQFDAFLQDGGELDKWRSCWTEAGWAWINRSGNRLRERYGDPFDLPNHPGAAVSWYEAVAFCNWLSAKLGFTVSLPTEAQWEKAARGVDGRSYPWGEEITPEHCNYAETRINTTSAVGIFPRGASPYGALDLSGNVWEWCLTKVRASYKEAEDNDLKGVDARVLRGGAFNPLAGYVRCAARDRLNPVIRLVGFGFRVVASPVS
jgi:formylglycine-generating enzyme required for sulfatase activity/energy-coupling factor transporter ATP-binding protein EcfA2